MDSLKTKMKTQNFKQITGIVLFVLWDLNAKIGKEQIFKYVVGTCHNLHKTTNDNGKGLQTL